MDRQAEQQTSDLLERCRAAGVTFGGRSVVVERMGDRIFARVLMPVEGDDVDHLYQEIDGRLVVARTSSGKREVAWLDGPAPDDPNAAEGKAIF